MNETLTSLGAGEFSEWHAVVGYAGLILILAGYILLQGWKLQRRAGTYLTLNLLGSGLVLVSLFHRPNLPAAILEGIWFLVSLVFLVRLARRRTARFGK